MSINFNTPIESQTVAARNTSARDAQIALARWLEGVAVTGAVAGIKRLSNGVVEEWSGTAWAEKALAYAKSASPTFTGTIMFTDGGSVSAGLSYGGSATFGTSSAHALNLTTNNTQRVSIAAAGNVTINAPSSGEHTIYGQLSCVTAGGDGFRLSSNASTVTGVTGEKGGLRRWYLILGNNEAESGSNAGSNLVLARFGDAGEFLGVPIACNRATGAITINAPSSGGHTIYGQLTLLGGLTATSFTGDGSSLTALNASNLGSGTVPPTRLNAYSDGVTTAELGWRSIPQNLQAGNYTLVAADRGRHVGATGAGAIITIPSGVFAVNDAATIVNMTTGNITIAQGAGTTLRLAGTANTGNRTLAQRGKATFLCPAANEFYISGPGLS